MELIKKNVLKSFRNASIFVFAFICIYAPLNYLLKSPVERETIQISTLLITSGFSIFAIALIIFLDKLKLKMETKTTILVFAYLLGMAMVLLRIYSSNMLIFGITIIALIPTILIQNRWALGVYNGIVLGLVYLTAGVGTGGIPTSSQGLVVVSDMILTSKITALIVVLVGMIVAMFLRRAIMSIFEDLNNAIETSNAIMEEQVTVSEKIKNSIGKTALDFDELEELTSSLKEVADQIGLATEDLARGAMNQTTQLDSAMGTLNELGNLIEKTLTTIEKVSSQASESEQLNHETEVR